MTVEASGKWFSRATRKELTLFGDQNNMDTSLDVWISPGNAPPETIAAWFQLLLDLFGVRAEVHYDYGHQTQPNNNVRVKLFTDANGELLEKAKEYLMDLCALEEQKPDRHWNYSKAPCERQDGTDEPKEFRAKLQSEDSSYDSDYEASELTSPGEQRIEHEEVSRTVSDTLSAEFAEYVTCGQAQENEPSHQHHHNDPDSNNTNFTSRLEFALKLGYTENQARVALHKLGPQPGQNELLAELIRLSAQGQSGKGSSSSTASSAGDDCNVQGQAIAAQSPANLAQSGGGAVKSSTPSPQVPCVSSFGDDGAANVFERNMRTRVDPGTEDGCHLRHVVIDGSNVAMSHGNKEQFSCRGIKLCVDWFKNRGHKKITVFVPRWRKEASRPDALISDQEILLDLEKERFLVFTPSRFVGGRRINCYDDRYILKLAADENGIVVSNDNYRDLVNETQEFKKVVEERLLMYSFVNDRFMPPEDPLGRHGPSLDNFLRKRPKPPETLPPLCPYGKKCTYGNKCKYYHPERGNQPQKSVTERLAEQAKSQIQEVKARSNKSRDSSPGDLRLKASLSLPVTSSTNQSSEKPLRKMALTRTHSAVPAGTSVQQQNLADPSSSATWGHHHPQPSHSAVGGGGGGGGALAGAGGGHLSVAKRLSDPDSHQKQASAAAEGGNQHRKLQRQLTLGFEHDPRLGRMRNFVNPHPPPQTVVDAPTSAPAGDAILHQMQHQRTHLHPHPHPHLQPHYVGMEGGGGGGHRPLARHGSDQGRWRDPGGVPQQHAHQAVHRIASAPDSYAQGPGGCQQQRRLNSTSDTQLNAYHFDPWPMTAVAPISHQQPPAWQECPGVPHPQADPQRFRIYYHLSSLFQPEQVKAAMMVHPEETDVQKICTTILAMFPTPQ